MILGIDEVGRGPWAGPLVIGAVVLGCEIEGLTDSKKLSAKRRAKLASEIHERAAAVGLGWVHADEIDAIGLSRALVEATKRAVEQINVPYHEIIIDGTINFLADTGKGQYVTLLKKADLLIPSVSAASIVAKVARDEFMVRQEELYPDYGFAAHVGYGTATHRAAIERYGITPLHRLSFAPLAKYASDMVAGPATPSAPKNSPDKLKQFLGATPRRVTRLIDASQPTTKQIGDKAETVVAEYLQSNGHEIVERNWKTKFCEIDIVSQKDDCLYFTEVKYRKNTNQGGGIAAITPKKLKQMKFAAEYYALKHDIKTMHLRPAASEVIGEKFTISSWLEIE
jgi:ribonuclease HII